MRRLVLLVAPPRTARLVAREAAAAAARVLAVCSGAVGGAPRFTHGPTRRPSSSSSSSSSFASAGAADAERRVLALEKPRDAKAAVGTAVVRAVGRRRHRVAPGSASGQRRRRRRRGALHSDNGRARSRDDVKMRLGVSLAGLVVRRRRAADGRRVRRRGEHGRERVLGRWTGRRNPLRFVGTLLSACRQEARASECMRRFEQRGSTVRGLRLNRGECGLTRDAEIAELALAAGADARAMLDERRGAPCGAVGSAHWLGVHRRQAVQRRVTACR